MDFHIRKEADVSKVELPVRFARGALIKSANLRALKSAPEPAERLYLAIVYFGQPERFAQFSTSSFVLQNKGIPSLSFFIIIVPKRYVFKFCATCRVIWEPPFFNLF